jgi:hypothetical protein
VTNESILCRVWAERLRYWLRDNVIAPLLERMKASASEAAKQQQALGMGLVIPSLPPSSGHWEDLELASDADLQRGISAANQALQQAKQQVQQSKPTANTGGGGLFGGMGLSNNEQQQQQHQQHVEREKALSAAHKVS